MFSSARETYNFFGNENIEKFMLKSINSRKLHHAYLFTGAKGLGKATFAYRVSKYILSNSLQDNMNVDRSEKVDKLIRKNSHPDFMVLSKDIDNENRLENIKELLSAMKEFDNLESFLEHVSLATSVDQEWDGEKINMMTIHAAKGLEFDVVFLPGWEEGLFPHQKSIEEKGQNGLEEERRLAYVGITRAKKKAIISFSMNRFYQGDWIDSMASRFIDELPEKNLEKNSFFDEEVNDGQDFDFNQDFDIEENTRSPGWIRYQKRIK